MVSYNFERFSPAVRSVASRALEEAIFCVSNEQWAAALAWENLAFTLVGDADDGACDGVAFVDWWLRGKLGLLEGEDAGRDQDLIESAEEDDVSPEKYACDSLSELRDCCAD